MPDFGIVPDSIFPMIYAEKGVVSFDLNRELKSQNLLTFQAGKAYNVVPDQARAEISYHEKLEVPFTSYLDRHGLSSGNFSEERDKQILTLEGKAAHAAEPSEGINAALHLAHFLVSLHLDQDAKNFLNLIENYLWQDTKGKTLSIFHQDQELGDNTLNTTFITLENGQARLGINWRYPASLNFNQAWSHLQGLSQKEKWQLNLISHQEPSHANLDSPETKLLLDTYRKHTDDQTPPLAIGGITYGRVFDRGITFGSFFLGKPATLHQPNEYIELADLWKALEIYLDALYQLATEEGQEAR